MKPIHVLLFAATLVHAQRAIDLTSADGTRLKATYFAATKPGPGVLLLHQSNRDRKSWDGEATQLAAAGFNTLTLDMRGHGESAGKGGDFDRMPDDVDRALEFLTSQPGVDPRAIGAGGAGWLGVTYAVEAARRHPTHIKSLVLMSGETGRDGLQFLHQASQLPELFVFSDEDEYPPTQDAMKLLYVTASSHSKKLVLYSAAQDAPWLWYETSDASKVPAHGGHGTDMFSAHSELAGIIVQWFVTTLVKTPGHAPADSLAAAPILNQLQTPGGAVQAKQQLVDARQKDPLAQLWPEVAVDIIGEDYQRVGDVKNAIEVFLLNLLAYPDSADAHSNLADAYLQDGQKELARQYAEKALSMLNSHTAPASSWSDTEQRRGEIRKAVQDVLAKLGAAQQQAPQTQAPAPVRSRADETLEWWNQIGEEADRNGQGFPEGKYDFKLQKDERTFAENLLHVAAVDYDVISRVAGMQIGPHFGADRHNPPREDYKTKADIVKLLEAAITDGAAVIQQQSDAGLDKTQQFGWETGRHVVHNSYIWVAAIEHSAEHFGQLAVYYRADNLVPPESRR